MFRHAIKTAFAAALTIILYRLLALPLLDQSDETWAVVSAVIVMQSNLGGSFKAALTRIEGTALGAMIGAAFAHWLGAHALAVAGAVGLTVLVCSWLGLKDSLRLAGATAILVMLTVRDAGAWATGVHRFGDIVAGIGMALVTQLLVLPSKAGRELQQGVALGLTETGRLYQMVAEAYLKGDYPQEAVETQREHVRQALLRNRDLLGDLAHEPFARHRQEPLWVALASRVGDLRDHILALDRAARLAQGDSYFRKLEPRLGELVQVSAAAFRWAAEAVIRKPTGPAPDLNAAVTAVDEAFAQLRQVHATRDFTTDEVLRFCTFFFALRSVARDLTLMTDSIAGRSPEKAA